MLKLSKLIKNKGFTLIELLVVIAIIGVLSSVVLASLNTARAKARDANRISDMHQMQLALDIYYLHNGQYPNSDNLGCGGWDTSGPGGVETTGTFTTALVNSGYLSQHLKDPITNNNCGNYKYYHYGPETGCLKNFYVLGVVDMETSGNPYPKSPGWSCTNRNWQGEMEWVTGKFD
jgi:type IV pilus assembly protein PilA